MTLSFPHVHHPCWSMRRTDLWERIHLPVAKECNLQCNFCLNQLRSCSTIGPGGCKRAMTVEEALSCLDKEMMKSNRLNIVAISGPGEPLHNESTFLTLETVRNSYPEIKMCLSTNGILLKQSIHRLSKIGLDTISVSMSAIKPDTVAQIYHWAIIEGKKVHGMEMAKSIPYHQLEGIRAASQSGMKVKVNTILIPDLNFLEVPELSQAIKSAGATLQNIVPLIPRGAMSKISAPSFQDLNKAREVSSKIIPQFRHCGQCRSDVIGIPGSDRILT